MPASLPLPNANHLPRRLAHFLALCVGGLLLSVALATTPEASAQSAAEWNQIKAKCGLPSGAIYNTWVEQGAPCNQSSSVGGAASAQQQLAMQMTMAEAKMLGEGLHDALFGKAETPEQRQRRIAAKQLNNSGVWYMRQGDYANAIVEFQKALEKTPNDATILSNLTLARRLQFQSSLNRAAATQNSDALANALGSMPVAARPSSWDRPQVLFQNIDVNFTSNTVDLRNARTSSVDPGFFKKADPPSGSPLQTKEALSDAFDKALETDVKTPSQRDQLNSEFDRLLAPSEEKGAQANTQAPAVAKKPNAKAKPASTNSQTPTARP